VSRAAEYKFQGIKTQGKAVTIQIPLFVTHVPGKSLADLMAWKYAACYACAHAQTRTLVGAHARAHTHTLVRAAGSCISCLFREAAPTPAASGKLRFWSVFWKDS
jgi:hypothetical protein